MAFSKQRRRKLVASIIANELFDEDAKDSLNDLTDNQLVALLDPDQLDTLVAKTAGITDNSDDAEDAADDDEDTTEVTDNMGKKLTDCSDEELMMEMKKRKGKKGKMTDNRSGSPAEEAQAIEDYLASTNAPDVIKRLIANQVAIDSEDRTRYIETITGNESSDFSEDELAEMSTPQLARIARLCDNSDDSDYQAASDWSANSGTNWSLGSNRDSGVEPLGTTDWSFDEE